MMLEHKSGGQASHRHTQYKTNGQQTGQTPLHKRWYVLSLSLPLVSIGVYFGVNKRWP